VQKIDSSGTRNYITDGDSPAAAVLSDGLATFTPGLSERRSSTSSFYHGDALGSTRSQTNSSQTVSDTKRYDAFGMLIASTGSNPTPFGFVGGSQYQTDADSGLMLLGHRYYDASIGRFISRDPIYAGDNWYAYCENNPLDHEDAEGLDDGGTRKTGKLPKPKPAAPETGNLKLSLPGGSNVTIGATTGPDGNSGMNLGGTISIGGGSSTTVGIGNIGGGAVSGSIGGNLGIGHGSSIGANFGNIGKGPLTGGGSFTIGLGNKNSVGASLDVGKSMKLTGGLTGTIDIGGGFTIGGQLKGLGGGAIAPTLTVGFNFM
jgi:RHS repeat-associated protein